MGISPGMLNIPLLLIQKSWLEPVESKASSKEQSAEKRGLFGKPLKENLAVRVRGEKKIIGY